LKPQLENVERCQTLFAPGALNSILCGTQGTSEVEEEPFRVGEVFLVEFDQPGIRQTGMHGHLLDQLLTGFGTFHPKREPSLLLNLRQQLEKPPLPVGGTGLRPSARTGRDHPTALPNGGLVMRTGLTSGAGLTRRADVFSGTPYDSVRAMQRYSPAEAIHARTPFNASHSLAEG
jgi:hypothetical protein